MFGKLVILIDVFDVAIYYPYYPNATPFCPIQYHLLLMYCNVHPSPMSLNVIVPVPLDFHPALVTVITMSPPSATIINVLICPVLPAANVAVLAADVVK
jgi:hypothetical protein